MPRPRRASVWLDSLIDETVSNTAQGVVDLTNELNDTASRMGGMTLVRTIICWDLSYAVHDSGEGSQIVDIGIGVGSEESVLAEILPDPDGV